MLHIMLTIFGIILINDDYQQFIRPSGRHPVWYLKQTPFAMIQMRVVPNPIIVHFYPHNFLKVLQIKQSCNTFLKGNPTSDGLLFDLVLETCLPLSLLLSLLLHCLWSLILAEHFGLGVNTIHALLRLRLGGRVIARGMAAVGNVKASVESRQRI